MGTGPCSIALAASPKNAPTATAESRRGILFSKVGAVVTTARRFARHPAHRLVSDRLNRACHTSVVCFHVSDPPPYFPACLDRPNSRQKGRAGFTRSSTTASASLRGGTPKACGCSPAMATISRRASRRSSTRSRACRCDRASWTVRPSSSTNAASRYSTLSVIGFATTPPCSVPSI